MPIGPREPNDAHPAQHIDDDNCSPLTAQIHSKKQHHGLPDVLAAATAAESMDIPDSKTKFISTKFMTPTTVGDDQQPSYRAQDGAQRGESVDGLVGPAGIHPVVKASTSTTWLETPMLETSSQPQDQCHQGHDQDNS